MFDTLTPLQRHNNMANIRGKNTSPEMKVRKWLHEAMRWKLLTIWECKLKREAFEQTMERLATSLLSNRENWLLEKEKRKIECEAARATRIERKARSEALSAELSIPNRLLGQSPKTHGGNEFESQRLN